MTDFNIIKLAERPEWTELLSEMWYQGLGRFWVKESTPQSAAVRFKQHLNIDKLPIAYVAVQQDRPIGMVCLRITEGIREEFTPWMGGLVVHPDFQHLGIGKKLIDYAKQQAIQFNYKELYLLTFEKKLAQWYEKLGWYIIDHEYAFGHPIIIMSIQLT